MNDNTANKQFLKYSSYFTVIIIFLNNHRKRTQTKSFSKTQRAFPDAHAAFASETQTEIYTRPPSANPQIIRGRTSINSPWSKRPTFCEPSPHRLNCARISALEVHRVICVFLAALIDFQIIRARTRTQARKCNAFPAPCNSRISRYIIKISYISSCHSYTFVFQYDHFFFRYKTSDWRKIMRNFIFNKEWNHLKIRLKHQLA